MRYVLKTSNGRQSSLNPMKTAYEKYGSIFKPKITHACKSMMLFQDGQSGEGDGAFVGGGGPSRTRLDGDG